MNQNQRPLSSIQSLVIGQDIEAENGLQDFNSVPLITALYDQVLTNRAESVK